MTYLSETRWHWFSLDSNDNLAAAVLELSTDGGTNWETATHTTAPASASLFPAPAAGQTRFWWKALIGPTQTLELASLAQEVSGRLTNGAEVLQPEWVVYSEDDLDSPPECWPLDSSCLGAVWQGFDTDVQDRAALLAVETLRMLTGYRVGGCPVLVRPCRRACGPIPSWMTYPVGRRVGGGDSAVGGWHPALQSGTWVNITCGCTGPDCSCGPICEVTLPGGVAYPNDVIVYLDGITLDPTTYRIDSRDRLVRIDGGCWPTCQDMALDPDEVGTFAVSYTPGSPVGTLGAIAAGRLAVEYGKACAGQNCALPPNVRSVSRLGVTLDLTNELGAVFPGGYTGIREVDLFIARHNPHGLRTPSGVWSPDLPSPRRFTPPGSGGTT